MILRFQAETLSGDQGTQTAPSQHPTTKSGTPAPHIGFYIIPQQAPNSAMHHTEKGSASSPPLPPLPFSSGSRADLCTGAFCIVGVWLAPGDHPLHTRAEIQAARPSVPDSLTLSFHLIPCFPILKGIQFFVCNFPQLLCFDDDSQLRVITKFH